MTIPYQFDTKHSGMIGDKEVAIHRVSEFGWVVDIVLHTSDDTKELLDGYIVRDEDRALALYDELVKELQERWSNE